LTPSPHFFIGMQENFGNKEVKDMVKTKEKVLVMIPHYLHREIKKLSADRDEFLYETLEKVIKRGLEKLKKETKDELD